MDHFQYHRGELHAEDTSIRAIAEAVGTPFYCYSTATLEHHYHVFQKALDDHGLGQRALICFAVKSNSNIAVLATLAQCGAGADIVSAGELMRALKAGIAANKVAFSGVGKTQDEMAIALKAGIRQFNVESLAELHELNAVAASLNMIAPVSFRLNPDIDAGTHEKISTGKAENKFGIHWHEAEQAYETAASLAHVAAHGVDIHIGSQITDLAPFAAAFEKTTALVMRLRGLGHAITTVDLGGGLGIPYQKEASPPSPADYARIVKDSFAVPDCDLIFEPGRMISGNAGVLVTSVIRTKKGMKKNFIIVDAAMTELLRPTLYGAYHEISPVLLEHDGAKGSSDALPRWDIVGPVCETGDYIAQDRALAEPVAGDLLCVATVGAYGAVLGSSYNTRPLAPEVLVKGAEFRIIRHRPSLEDMLEMETIPQW